MANRKTLAQQQTYTSAQNWLVGVTIVGLFTLMFVYTGMFYLG